MKTKRSNRCTDRCRWRWKRSPLTSAALAASLLLALPAGAARDELQCHVERGTEAHTCFAADEVRLRNGNRIAPLYSGGPDGVRRTRQRIEVDCAAGIVRLRDADGVVYAIDAPRPPLPAYYLSRWICAARLAR